MRGSFNQTESSLQSLRTSRGYASKKNRTEPFLLGKNNDEINDFIRNAFNDFQNKDEEKMLSTLVAYHNSLDHENITFLKDNFIYVYLTENVKQIERFLKAEIRALGLAEKESRVIKREAIPQSEEQMLHIVKDDGYPLCGVRNQMLPAYEGEWSLESIQAYEVKPHNNVKCPQCSSDLHKLSPKQANLLEKENKFKKPFKINTDLLEDYIYEQINNNLGSVLKNFSEKHNIRPVNSGKVYNRAFTNQNENLYDSLNKVSTLAVDDYVINMLEEPENKQKMVASLKEYNSIINAIKFSDREESFYSTSLKIANKELGSFDKLEINHIMLTHYLENNRLKAENKKQFLVEQAVREILDDIV